MRPAPGTNGNLEAPRFDVANGVQNSTLFDAVLSGIQGFNYLAAQPDVDKREMGITGFSWGGYATTFLSGLLGNRVKASYAVFGCGFYDKGSYWAKILHDLPTNIQEKWLNYFDAGRRVHGMKAAYFVEASSNDTYFWPEAVDNTLTTIPGKEKNHVWDPNFNHKQMPAGPQMQKIYFDHYLKHSAQPFPSVAITADESMPDKARMLTLKVSIPDQLNITSVCLYYSLKTDNWQNRQWMTIPAKYISRTVYTVNIPAVLAQQAINYYAYGTDSRGVSVASEMMSLEKHSLQKVE